MSADFLIFDFETLSNIPATAPVISLGAIAGKWKDCNTKEELRQSGFYRNIDSIHQVKDLGLEPSISTMQWWASQGDEAKAVLKATDKISIEQTIHEFNSWCGDNGVNNNTLVWLRAPHFDFVIYSNLVQRTGLSTYEPFSHWKIRDTRTACDLIYSTNRGYPPNYKELEKEYDITKHNALDDCIFEYMLLKDWFQYTAE